MNTSEKQFISIIRCALKKESYPLIEDWFYIWRLACNHHLEALVYETTKDDPSIPKGLKKIMEETFFSMVLREERMAFALEMLEEALTMNNIPYALMKGAVLKTDYPENYMRFMSDLDFYIRPEDRKAIKRIMEDLGGILENTDSGDESYLLFDTVGVEFHGMIHYQKKKTIHPYAAWNYVDLKTNRLTENGFALNLIGHSIYDLSHAGPGVRFILDQWVYRNRHAHQPDWNFVYKRLKDDGLFEVANNIYNLSEYLFGNQDASPLLMEMADYVIKGGLYGDAQRRQVSEAAYSGGKGNAIAKQIFRSKEEFYNRYPWLKKYPYLLPVAWLHRGIKSISNHGDAIISWNKKMGNVSKEEIDNQRSILERFGL